MIAEQLDASRTKQIIDAVQVGDHSNASSDGVILRMIDVLQKNYHIGE
ncbi:unnamed protein product [Anisakis simplex]|uniref:Chemotaxis protein n=1 Tax=Anisakis simplex TaxID=6269 RepID=A0A0M3KJ59_ANISI|nr:unnamed protein product [Anisakis simplex]